MITPKQKEALRRWAPRVGLVLACATLFWWTALTKRQPRSIRSLRPNLADIKFKPAIWRGTKGWTATFEVDVDIKRAWHIMSDCQRYHKVIKGMELCRKVGAGENEEGPYTEYHLDLHSPKGGFMRIRAWNKPQAYSHEWVLLEGSAVFGAGKGYARLRRHPKHPGWTMIDYGYFLRLNHWIFTVAPGLETDRVFKSIKRMAQEIQEYFSPEAAKQRAALARARKAQSSPGGRAAPMAETKP